MLPRRGMRRCLCLFPLWMLFFACLDVQNTPHVTSLDCSFFSPFLEQFCCNSAFLRQNTSSSDVQLATFLPSRHVWTFCNERRHRHSVLLRRIYLRAVLLTLPVVRCTSCNLPELRHLRRTALSAATASEDCIGRRGDVLTCELLCPHLDARRS